jgi:hypothetical protein
VRIQGWTRQKNDEEHNDYDGATIFFVVSLKSFDGIDHHLMFVAMPALSRVIEVGSHVSSSLTTSQSGKTLESFTPGLCHSAVRKPFVVDIEI